MSFILQLVDNVGMVNTVLESGDLLIRYPNNSVLVFNPEAVTKVSMQKYIHMQGDVHTHSM